MLREIMVKDTGLMLDTTETAGSEIKYILHAKLPKSLYIPMLTNGSRVWPGYTLNDP